MVYSKIQVVAHVVLTRSSALNGIFCIFCITAHNGSSIRSCCSSLWVVVIKVTACLVKRFGYAVSYNSLNVLSYIVVNKNYLVACYAIAFGHGEYDISIIWGASRYIECTSIFLQQVSCWITELATRV